MPRAVWLPSKVAVIAALSAPGNHTVPANGIPGLQDQFVGVFQLPLTGETQVPPLAPRMPEATRSM